MSVFKKVPELFLKVSDRFVDREEDVLAVITGLLSGEPVLLIGDPGTAKTKMIEVVSRYIDAKYFYYLLTRFTEPDEILGPIDINALRKGEYRRVMDNRLPTANIVFLDEVFKASSSIRNTLLDIILNKRIMDGARYISLPMLALYTASNEISYDEEDQAFFDRLVIRRFVKPVGDVELLLEKGVLLENDAFSELEPLLSVNDVQDLQRVVRDRMKFLLKYKTKIALAFNELGNHGLFVSDRTKVKTLKIASAISLLLGEDVPTLDSFSEALRLTAVSEAEDIEKVEQVIIDNRLSSITNNVKKLERMRIELENKIAMAKKKRDLESIKALGTVMRKVVSEVKVMPKNIMLLRYIKRLNSVLQEGKLVIEDIKEELNIE